MPDLGGVGGTSPSDLAVASQEAVVVQKFGNGSWWTILCGAGIALGAYFIVWKGGASASPRSVRAFLRDTPSAGAFGSPLRHRRLAYLEQPFNWSSTTLSPRS